MKRKKTFYSEFAYFFGILILAIGTAMMARADLGMSMVVAPAYLLHLKISQYVPWFSFGISEYMFQAFLLIILSIILRKFKKGYIFSFVTAVIYGIMLDVSIKMISFFPGEGITERIVFFIIGMITCSLGVCLFFHTYISPEAYELFVKEMSGKTGKDIGRIKTVYDCCSCLVGIVLSFIFFGFGHFEGVKIGTVICALLNGRLISVIGIMLEKIFVFRDVLPWRDFFEK